MFYDKEMTLVHAAVVTGS